MTKDSKYYGFDDRGPAEIFYSPVCNLCKCFSIRHSIDSGIPVCIAFPEGIPEEIWRGANNHTKPYTGDHNIQFEQSYSAE